MVLKTEFDDGGFKYFLKNLEPKKMKAPFSAAIRKSLQIVKKATIQNLKGLSFKNGKKLNVRKPVIMKTHYWKTKTGSYTFPSFSNSVVVKTAKRSLSGFVTILSSNKLKRNPILSMIERSKGTRFTKGGSKRKSHSTGSIAHSFFTPAVNSTKEQVRRQLKDNVYAAINKVREKQGR